LRKLLKLTTIFILFLSCENGDELSHISLNNWVETKHQFRAEQLRYQRVRTAYANKENYIKKLLTSKNINSFDFDLYLRAFKQEEVLEVWIKPKGADHYIELIKYPFCNTSGILGPKRIAGDRQIPEGFYELDHYNQTSNYLLSLRVNYPNVSDQILSDQERPGGEIYIHGGCATIGCIPITDRWIEELYILATEGKKVRQNIPIHIYPLHLNNNNWKSLKRTYKNQANLIQFWTGLKEGFDLFESCNILPQIRVLTDGQYQLKNRCN